MPTKEHYHTASVFDAACRMESQGKAQTHLSPNVRQAGSRNTAVNQNNDPLYRYSLGLGGRDPPTKHSQLSDWVTAVKFLFWKAQSTSSLRQELAVSVRLQHAAELIVSEPSVK